MVPCPGVVTDRGKGEGIASLAVSKSHGEMRDSPRS